MWTTHAIDIQPLAKPIATSPFDRSTPMVRLVTMMIPGVRALLRIRRNVTAVMLLNVGVTGAPLNRFLFIDPRRYHGMGPNTRHGHRNRPVATSYRSPPDRTSVGSSSAASHPLEPADLSLVFLNIDDEGEGVS